ncbi:MAG TPA: hypothetical protein VN132_01150, partial [Bdellovibrio sp.]|nr:hypothetical protein [Bdellovibrio sp.]
SGDSSAIYKAIVQALEFKANNLDCDFSIYGDGNTSEKMLEILKKNDFSSYPKKNFFDQTL